MLLILVAAATVIMVFVLMDRYIQARVFTIGHGTAVNWWMFRNG